MDHLAPSAYHDPREVVWKHLVAQAYWDILDLLRRDGVALDDLAAIRFAFLRSFNGNHDIDLLCRQAEQAASELAAGLRQQGHAPTAAAAVREIDALRGSLARAMDSLEGLRQVDRTQSYVIDRLVTIAGKPAEEFAANPDYIGATLQLVGEHSAETAAQALAAWRRGFALDSGLLELVRGAVAQGWHSDDLLAEVLLREQRSGVHPSLRGFEFVTGRSAEENRGARRLAIEAGYFLLGRLMSCVSLMNAGSAPLPAGELPGGCPVAATLRQAGLAPTPAWLRAFRQFMLVHATHGLNPGEFTARIAASVRTSFPQALIASLMVRAGKMHAGALPECMRQIDAYLQATSRRAFVADLLGRGELYGFGHRIHKHGRAAGGDPRVAFQIARAREAFPELAARIDAIEEFAQTVRDLKPGLAPNTDFGAATWFHCFGLAPEVGAGMFSMNRLPGLIAQVINQLDFKANALRPPLAVNLPYTA
jgi:citrate synthase